MNTKDLGMRMNSLKTHGLRLGKDSPLKIKTLFLTPCFKIVRCPLKRLTELFMILRLFTCPAHIFHSASFLSCSIHNKLHGVLHTCLLYAGHICQKQFCLFPQASKFPLSMFDITSSQKPPCPSIYGLSIPLLLNYFPFPY